MGPDRCCGNRRAENSLRTTISKPEAPILAVIISARLCAVMRSLTMAKFPKSGSNRERSGQGSLKNPSKNMVYHEAHLFLFASAFQTQLG
jgi:hypothetical protein